MKINQFLSRVCPICGERPIGKSLVVSDVQAESLDYEALVPHWNGFFKDKVIFSYTKCHKCELLFTPTFFTNSQLEQLYAQMPPNMEDVPIEALRRTQQGYFENLKNNAKLTGGFIEIGPDIGLFTENCVREGNYSEYWLFEPNMEVTSVLSKIVKGRKYHVIHDMFSFSSVPDQSASTAVMIHVLDHLLDPVTTLLELRQKLKPGAKLLLVTHNELSLLRHLIGWRWPAFCLQHPQIYNPQTIRTLLSNAGFEIIQLNKSKNYFPIDYLLKHMLWAFNIKLKDFRFVSTLLGLKLGNMQIIATPVNSMS